MKKRIIALLVKRKTFISKYAIKLAVKLYLNNYTKWAIKIIGWYEKIFDELPHMTIAHLIRDDGDAFDVKLAYLQEKGYLENIDEGNDTEETEVIGCNCTCDARCKNDSRIKCMCKSTVCKNELYERR